MVSNERKNSKCRITMRLRITFPQEIDGMGTVEERLIKGLYKGVARYREGTRYGSVLRRVTEEHWLSSLGW